MVSSIVELVTSIQIQHQVHFSPILTLYLIVGSWHMDLHGYLQYIRHTVLSNYFNAWLNSAYLIVSPARWPVSCNLTSSPPNVCPVVVVVEAQTGCC